MFLQIARYPGIDIEALVETMSELEEFDRAWNNVYGWY
jgi:hypothetical protein